MSVYVPADNHASDIIEWFSIGYKAFLADMRKNFHCWPATAEAPQIISDTVVFTKKIYVYHDNILTGEQVHNLESVYRAQGLEPTFRGSGYLEIRRLQAKVDPNTAPKELGTTKVIKGPPLPPIDMNLKD